MSIRLVIIASLSTPPKFWLMCSRMLGVSLAHRGEQRQRDRVFVLYGAVRP